jgi:hypothetical protein
MEDGRGEEKKSSQALAVFFFCFPTPITQNGRL